MQFAGPVTKIAWAQGSKSEHAAVVIETGGKRLKLRRAGGNPFADKELDKLIGKSISGQGELLPGATLLISSWKETGKVGS